jgi:anti-sigma-K factor RskA
VPIADRTDSAEEPYLNSRSRGMFSTYETYEEPKRGRGAVIAAWTGWAIAAGVAIVAGLQFHQHQVLQATLNDTNAKLTQSAAATSKAEQVLQTLTNEGAMQITMRIPPPDGVPQSKLPEGHAAYDAAKGSLVFVASNMLPVPQDKTYELWVLPQSAGEAPVPAGTFRPDQNGNASVVMPEIPKGVTAKGFGVTIEDAGGAKAPTLPIVLVGL